MIKLKTILTFINVVFVDFNGGDEGSRTPVRKSFPCCIYVCSQLYLVSRLMYRSVASYTIDQSQ